MWGEPYLVQGLQKVPGSCSPKSPSFSNSWILSWSWVMQFLYGSFVKCFCNILIQNRVKESLRYALQHPFSRGYILLVMTISNDSFQEQQGLVQTGSILQIYTGAVYYKCSAAVLHFIKLSRKYSCLIFLILIAKGSYDTSHLILQISLHK